MNHERSLISKSVVTMQVFGHRGAAGEAPENTIAGLHHAIKRGLSYAEIDLRLSADQKIIVCHDANTLRTCGVKRHQPQPSLSSPNSMAAPTRPSGRIKPAVAFHNSAH